jgi:hypothetical protein
MIQPKKKIIRKKVSKKRGSSFAGIVRLCSILFLLLILVFSVCTVGYVIFFRTVYAQQIPPSINSAIAFEEPAPPHQNNHMGLSIIPLRGRIMENPDVLPVYRGELMFKGSLASKHHRHFRLGLVTCLDGFEIA